MSAGLRDDLLADARLLLLVPILLPWTVVFGGGALTLVYPWGLVSPWPLPVTVVPLSRYLLSLTSGLPRYLLAWPWSTFLYACALAVTTAVHHLRVGPWLDDDATAALLALAGASHLLVSLGLWRTGRIAVPLGTAVLWALAWVVYAGDA